MSKEHKLVKYHNQLNKTPIKGLTEVEHNLFVAILYKLKDQGTNTVVIPKSELIELTNFERGKKVNFTDSILNFISKILQFYIHHQCDATTIESYAPFQTRFDVLDKTLTVKVHENFQSYLNYLNSNFTQFELDEFVEISGKYAKILYRQLKQFRDTGHYVCDWSDFLDLMDIPSSYRTSDIERQILKQAVVELSSERNLFNNSVAIFEDLRYNKIRGKGRGGPIEKIEFFWTVKKSEQEDINVFSNIDELRSWLFCNVDCGALYTNIAMIEGKYVSIARYSRRDSSNYKGTKIVIGHDDYTQKAEADRVLGILFEAIKKDKLDEYFIDQNDELSSSMLLYSMLKIKYTDKENLKRCSDEVKEIYPKVKKLLEKFILFPTSQFADFFPSNLLNRTLKIENVFISYDNKDITIIASHLQDGERIRKKIQNISTHEHYTTIKNCIITPSEEEEVAFNKAVIGEDN